MELKFQKKLAAFLSVCSNTCLIVLKLIAGYVSGSISVLSEAMHSLSDLIASFLALFSVNKSSEPADEEHPFGHGKYEDMAGFIEAILIIFTALYIYYLVAQKIYTQNFEIADTNLAIIIMFISVLLNFAVSMYLMKVSKKTDSIALWTDAQHLNADIYTSLAILSGLIMVKITGIHVFDPIFATIVATLILITGIKLSKQSLNNLLDGSLPKYDKEAIYKVLTDFENEGISKVKSIKTTKSGAKKVVQLVIYLKKELTLEEAHQICDEMECKIRENLKNSEIMIHPEPI